MLFCLFWFLLKLKIPTGLVGIFAFFKTIILEILTFLYGLIF